MSRILKVTSRIIMLGLFGIIEECAGLICRSFFTLCYFIIVYKSASSAKILTVCLSSQSFSPKICNAYIWLSTGKRYHRLLVKYHDYVRRLYKKQRYFIFCFGLHLSNNWTCSLSEVLEFVYIQCWKKFYKSAAFIMRYSPSGEGL